MSEISKIAEDEQKIKACSDQRNFQYKLITRGLHRNRFNELYLVDKFTILTGLFHVVNQLSRTRQHFPMIKKYFGNNLLIKFYKTDLL